MMLGSSQPLKSLESRSRLFENPSLDLAIARAQKLFLTHQYPEGYWWYTLEANESIGSEFILLLHALGLEKEYAQVILQLAERIRHQQRLDGTWALYFEGPGDLSTTVECYFALRLLGDSPKTLSMQRAKDFILSQGGICKTRVFTKIHLAQFGLVPWEACPELPPFFMLFPKALGLSVYEFSSWARACIIPLIVLLHKKPTRRSLAKDFLEELFCEKNTHERNYQFFTSKGFFSLENFFIQTNHLLKKMHRLVHSPFLTQRALKNAERWIVQHVTHTEDIYPAMAYSALALAALGRPLEDPVIQKCLEGLLFFQQKLEGNLLPPLPSPAHSTQHQPSEKFLILNSKESALHQQCCISPVWDSPWMMTALLESGLSPQDPSLLKAARWLISKQITQVYGDWSVKNKKGVPGGWSFEFQNDYFPDVDDTLQILQVLFKVNLPRSEVATAFQRGLDWLISMQSNNGGWAAFDRNNFSRWVNKIPFSDHGACLDPPTPDITGRALELLGLIGYGPDYPVCAKALKFILACQESNGAWEGRWGVNYIYGTWCVLQGLQAMRLSPSHPALVKAAAWLESIQNKEGGWSESCATYLQKKFIPLPYSVPSQTAWALMGLIAAGHSRSLAVQRGIDFLLAHQNEEGAWNEEAYTGTGFPGHFYIRYHGYRHYFPLLALAKFKHTLQG